jgi:hypothetical protein
MGFRQGGPAGFGLRRVLIDQSGAGQRRTRPWRAQSLQTDRVILMPGPDSEVATVNQIYRWLVDEATCPWSEIVKRLNDQPILTDQDRPWTLQHGAPGADQREVHRQQRLQPPVLQAQEEAVDNPPEMWIRKEGAFEGIVPLIAKLRELYVRHGYLSGLIINEAECMPSAAAYAHRFGSLIRAYQAVGFNPERDYRYLEANQYLRRLHPEIIGQTEHSIEELGGAVRRDPATDLLTLNGEFTVSLVLSRCQQLDNGRRRWKVRFDASLAPDITVAVRLDGTNRTALDYYLLPRLDFGQPGIHLAEHNGIEFESYRFETLDYLYSMAERSRIRRAA